MSYFHKITHVFPSNTLCSICSFLSQKHHFLHEPPLLIQTSINWKLSVSVDRSSESDVRSQIVHMVSRLLTLSGIIHCYLSFTHTKITSHTLGKETNLQKMGGKWRLRKKRWPDSDEFLADTDNRRLTERLTACEEQPHCPLPLQSKRSCAPQQGQHPVPRWWPPC